MKRNTLITLLSALMLLIVDPHVVISYDYDEAGNRVSRTTLINSTPVQSSSEGGEEEEVETSESDTQKNDDQS